MTLFNERLSGSYLQCYRNWIYQIWYGHASTEVGVFYRIQADLTLTFDPVTEFVAYNYMHVGEMYCINYRNYILYVLKAWEVVATHVKIAKLLHFLHLLYTSWGDGYHILN